jgi:integrase
MTAGRTEAGLIRKRRGGLQVQVYAGRDVLTGNKLWRSKQVAGQSRTSWRKAREAEGRLLAEVAAGKRKGTARMTLGQLLDEWLEWRESNGRPISPSTLHNYRLTVERKIKPGLGKVAIDKIDPRTLDRFYAALRKGGNARTTRANPETGQREQVGGGALSGSRVRDVHAIMSGALGLAARWGYLPFNPAVLASPPAARSAARTLPTPDQAKELLKAAADQDPEFELFVRLGAVAGMRRGEVCALRWCDVDLDEAELAVSGNVLFIRGLEGGFVRKEPKSESGMRLIALDKRTVELLKAHRARCAARALASGASLSEAAYLFAKEPDGSRPIRPDAMTRRFKELAEELGHGYTLHGLRHFMATQLGAVAEAATVRARMGHGSLAVSSLYTHRVSAADRAAAEHMGRVLDG